MGIDYKKWHDGICPSCGQDVRGKFNIDVETLLRMTIGHVVHAHESDYDLLESVAEFWAANKVLEFHAHISTQYRNAFMRIGAFTRELQQRLNLPPNI